MNTYHVTIKMKSGETYIIPIPVEAETYQEVLRSIVESDWTGVSVSDGLVFLNTIEIRTIDIRQMNQEVNPE
jgi:hypothetical protein